MMSRQRIFELTGMPESTQRSYEKQTEFKEDGTRNYKFDVIIFIQDLAKKRDKKNKK